MPERKMKKHRIHLFDLVTSETTVNGIPLINRFFKVVGLLRCGELEEFGGVWKLKDIKTGEETQCLGKDLIVWKPEKL